MAYLRLRGQGTGAAVYISHSSSIQHDFLTLHLHPVGADAEFRVVEGLAGLDVELPLVPGAFEDLAFARVAHAGEPVRKDKGAQPAAAERAGLVGADVAEGVVVAVEVENADLPPVDGHDFAAAGRDFVDGGDDVRGHQSRP